MNMSKPVDEVIRERYSCRTYTKSPLKKDLKNELEEFIASNQKGPLGGVSRFEIFAATDEDRQSLKELGTYGFIKGVSAFIGSAVHDSEKNLEDFGYLMEKNILFATDLGLGTCWLGGTFTKSGFAKKMSLREGETVPAVVSLGEPAEKPTVRESLFRWGAGSKKRKPWNELFFYGMFESPLNETKAGEYGQALEMVRIAPSASNKQPWRIVKDTDKNIFHFYLVRTKNYYKAEKDFLKIADLQRVDMGIAMCHFELTARESGLKGTWQISDPGITIPDSLGEYVVSWTGKE